MPPKNSEVEEIVSRLAERQREINREDASFYEKVERVNSVGRVIWGIGVAIFSLGIWIATQQARISALEKEVEERKPDVQHIREMWWMREHGYTNRDLYGQPLPVTPPPK